MKQKYSNEQIAMAIELIKNTESNEEVMQYLNYTNINSFKSFCHRNKINVSELRCKSKIIKTLNSNYLDDLEFKFYLFGLIASDGQIDKDRNRIRILLHMKDEEILLKLKEIIFENSNEIPLYINKEIYRDLHISDSNLKSELYKYGITNCKTKTLKINFNLIPKENLADFMRGYFDGDGSVSIIQNEYNGKLYKKYLMVKIIGGYDTMNNFSKILKDLKICDYILRDITKEKYSFPFFELAICRMDEVPKLYEFLYKNNTCIFKLKRKYDIFNEVL